MLAHVFERQPAADSAHHVIGDLVRVAGGTNFAAGGGDDEARLNALQHEGGMKDGDEHESVAATHAPALREERGDVTDVVEHETAQHAIEATVGKGQPSRQIVGDELDPLPARLAAGPGHHPVTEIQSGDPRSEGGQTEGMAARATSEIRDREITNISKEGRQVLLLEQDERVVFRIVDVRPAVVTLFGGQMLDRPIGSQSWLEVRHGSYLLSGTGPLNDPAERSA